MNFKKILVVVGAVLAVITAVAAVYLALEHFGDKLLTRQRVRFMETPLDWDED
ncbi:MAG: hypothetical protein LBQ48_01305 [Oscillospiraceae bacterium]|jgi:K+ transporter|nr:hypothetical protein [Oscillospiraceae bacterium]